MHKPLDTHRIKQFEKTSGKKELTPANPERAEDTTTRWPSREPVRDGQISIKAPLDVLERFKRICKDDRRTYADMLEILMTGYEDFGKGRR